MVSSRQGDLFGHDEEEICSSDQPTPVYRADPDQVRVDLHMIFAEARAAQKMPWDLSAVALSDDLSADDQLAAGRGGRATALRVGDGIGAAGSRVSRFSYPKRRRQKDGRSVVPWITSLANVPESC